MEGISLWTIYGTTFLMLLALDFFVMRGRISARKSLAMTAFYVAAAMAFAVYVWHSRGAESASQFVTIFWLEKLLSVDNLLVISLIFGYFAVPERQQHKALFYGLAGAIVFRGIFIFGGAFILSQLAWLLYGFAAFLIWSGVGLMRGGEDGFKPEDSWIVRWAFSRYSWAPLLCAIIAIEVSDIMFAVDSIPASFGVSQNSFIIFTANLFAVLGLRSLYHAVNYGLTLLEGVEPWIGAALVALGLEVFAGHFLHIPGWVTMCMTMGIIGTGVAVNVLRKKEPAHV